MQQYLSWDLRTAVIDGSLSKLRAMLVSDWNQRDGGGMTPLALACDHGHLDVVEFLVRDQNVVVDTHDVRRRTPLHIASNHGHDGVVDFLLKSGARPDTSDRLRETPLTTACAKAHLKVVKLLLQHASSVEVEKAFSSACNSWKLGCYTVAKYILEQNPSIQLINSVDDQGRSPLLQVLRIWELCEDCDVRTDKAKLINYLVAMGATVDSKAFFYVATSRNNSAVYWIIRHRPELWEPLRQLFTAYGFYKREDNTSRWHCILKKDSFEMPCTSRLRKGRRPSVHSPTQS